MVIRLTERVEDMRNEPPPIDPRRELYEDGEHCDIPHTRCRRCGIKGEEEESRTAAAAEALRAIAALPRRPVRTPRVRPTFADPPPGGLLESIIFEGNRRRAEQQQEEEEALADALENDDALAWRASPIWTLCRCGHALHRHHPDAPHRCECKREDGAACRCGTFGMPSRAR